MPKITTPDIHVVLMQQEKWWVAQCLQYDIGAQAFSLEDALYELQRSLVGHISICAKHKKQPFEDLKPAPRAYWEKWNGAKIKLSFDEAPFRLPESDHLHQMKIPELKEIRVASH